MNLKDVNYIELGFKDKKMLVSRDGKEWETRIVVMWLRGYYYAWNNADTIEDSKVCVGLTPWKYAKELPKRIRLKR